jgi:hypothetical protein
MCLKLSPPCWLKLFHGEFIFVSISYYLKFWDFVLHDYLFTNFFEVLIFYFGSKVFSNLYEKCEFMFGLNFSLFKVLIFLSFLHNGVGLSNYHLKVLSFFHDHCFTNFFEVLIFLLWKQGLVIRVSRVSNFYEKWEFIFGLNFLLSKVLRFCFAWLFIY